jgi:hypothetical protein
MRFYRGVALLSGAATLCLSLGCGTILYPERRGQRTTARIDAGVAVMDGLWCLLFIIPGVIAFAVDFNNGAIYLPGGGASAGPLKVVRTPDICPDRVAIERAVEEGAGVHIRLDEPTVIRRRIMRGDNIARTIVEARQAHRSF